MVAQWISRLFQQVLLYRRGAVVTMYNILPLSMIRVMIQRSIDKYSIGNHPFELSYLGDRDSLLRSLYFNLRKYVLSTPAALQDEEG